MNIYELHADSDPKWVWLSPKDKMTVPLNTREEQPFFDAHPMIAVKRRQDSPDRQGKATLADFSTLLTYPVFGERARRVFGPHIDGLGRWIELKYELAPCWLFWTTNVVDALDAERSKFAYFRDRGIMTIDSFVFKPQALYGQWMFRVPQGTRRPHVTQPFVDLVREHKLTGFMFLRLWSSETGPTDLKVKDWLKPRITGLEPG